MDAQIQTLIYNALRDLSLLAVTVVGGALTRYIQQHFNTKQIETAKNIASIAVNSTEEIATAIGFKGADKLTLAMEKAKELAAKGGVKLSNGQWSSLIHDTLNNIRPFWQNISKPAPDPQSATPDPAVATVESQTS